MDEKEDRLEEREGFNLDSSGMMEIAAGVGVNIVIHPGDRNIKQIQIYTDAPLRFSDIRGPRLFTPMPIGAEGPNANIKFMELGVGCALQAYTEIDGGLVFDLTPLPLMRRRQEIKWHIENAEAAAAHVQVWILW